MKRTPIITFMVLLFLSSSTWGGNKSNVTAPTGDTEFDHALQDLNVAAQNDLRAFARKLSRYYNIPEETTDWLLDQIGMSPGDVYMAAKISKISDNSIEDVFKEYKKNQGKGWGVMAKRLGIKPGSREFHELKKDDSGLLGSAKGKSKVKHGKKKKGKKKK